MPAGTGMSIKQVDVVLLLKPGAMQLANSSQINLLTNYMYCRFLVVQ